MHTFRQIRAAVSALAMIAAAGVAGPAMAQTSGAQKQTCEKIQQSCLARVARANATQATRETDGLSRNRLTEADCSSAFAKAKATGVWPEHLPFNFDTPCQN